MNAQSLWPSGVDSFHDVSLDGYFACWVDSQRKVSVVVYAVAANYTAQTVEHRNSVRMNDEMLGSLAEAPVRGVISKALSVHPMCLCDWRFCGFDKCR